MKSEEELMKDIKNWRKNKLYQGIVNNNQKISLCEENKTLLEEIINDIISRRNVSELIRFTQNVIGFSLDDLTDKIIKTEDITYIYYFARYIQNAPIERLAHIIIESKSAEYIHLFAKDIKESPIEKLADVMIELQDIDHIYYFIRDVKNAPVEKMTDEIIRTYSMEKIKLLAKRLGVSVKEFYQTYSKEKNFAVELLMIEEDKEKVLTNLIDNIDKEDNLIKLRVYFDFLNNSESSLDDARSCDKEYKEYMEIQRKDDNKTLKK